MLDIIVIVLDVIAALFLIVTILLHSGQGERAVRHVRRHVVAVGRHRDRAALDRITVVTAIDLRALGLLALLAVEVAGPRRRGW